MEDITSHRCGTCGNYLREDDPVVRVENKYRRNSVLYFHADYRGCSESEQRNDIAFARATRGETREEMAPRS